MKIVINKCHGGFGLSHKAMMRYFELKGQTVYPEKIQSYFNGDWLTDEEKERADNFYSLWNYWKVPEEERLESGPESHEQNVYDFDLPRDDPYLIQVIEELGEESWGRYAELSIVNIPDDVEWQIDEYDGREWIAEQHRTWS